MKATRIILFVLIVCPIVFSGCDTASNTPSPVNKYFIKYYGDGGNQTGLDVAVNPDGTFVILGTTKKPGALHTDLFLVKADAQGNVIWQKTTGTPLDDEARDVEITSDGNVLVVGNTYVSETSRDILVLLLSQNGDTLQARQLGLKAVDLSEADDDISTVTEITDGYILTGTSDNVDVKGNGLSTDRDAIHLRLKQDFTDYGITWRPAHGGGSINVGVKVIPADDGTFNFFGYSNTNKPDDPTPNINFWVYKLTPFGESGVAIQQGTLGDDRLGSVSVTTSVSGDVFFLAGITTNSDNTSNVFVSRVNEKAPDLEESFQNSIGTNLNTPLASKTSVYASANGGCYVLTNEFTEQNYNLYLTKINNQGLQEWKSSVIFGGSGNDFSGSVTELPDGKLLISGTMAIGVDGETKMVLIKVNKDGQFAD